MRCLDQAAVFFQLGFARPAEPHALLLPRQVRPHPLQPRHGVFQLGQLDGQPGLRRLGAAGEDVEDQFGAVEDLQPDGLFQVAGLAGAQIVVEDHQVGVFGGGQRGELLDLAVAQIGGGIGGIAALGQPADHPHAPPFRPGPPTPPAAAHGPSVPAAARPTSTAASLVTLSVRLSSYTA